VIGGSADVFAAANAIDVAATTTAAAATAPRINGGFL
jgi:hypothetical protein